MAATLVHEPEQSTSPVCRETSPHSLIAAQGRLLVAAITLLAAGLRFYGLTSKTFWLDEAISVRLVRMSWPDFISTLWHHEANMTLYYLLLRFWITLGHSEGFIRSLSVLFSVATIPLVYALAARLFNRTTGLAAALVLSVNAYHVRYAQEARAYALVAFLATLATWLLVRNLDRKEVPAWGPYIAASAATVYCHYYGALVVIAHGVALLWLRCPRDFGKGFLRSLGWIVLLTAPLLPCVLYSRTSPLNWIPPLTSRSLLFFGLHFSGNYGPYLLVLTVMGIGLAALSAARRRQLGMHSEGAAGFQVVFAWFLVPVSIVILASLLSPMFVTRFLSPCLPAFVILVAAGIFSLRSPIPARALLVAVVGLSLAGTISYYRADFDTIRADWRDAARFVLSQVQPGDKVFFYKASGHVPFEFYKWLYAPSLPWPETISPPVIGPEMLRPQPESTAGTGLPPLPPGHRVWLVWYRLMMPDGSPDTSGYIVRDWFAKGRHRIAAQMFRNVNVTLYGPGARP